MSDFRAERRVAIETIASDGRALGSPIGLATFQVAGSTGRAGTLG